MTTIPTITEQDILTLAGKQNFQQGQQYFQDGAISDAYRQGITLKAYCYGSLPQPYRVQVTFDTKGVTGASCTCSGNDPMRKGSYCEHVAALLLTWLKQPEKFTQLPPLQRRLEQRSKAELVALITQIVQEQPEVEWKFLMPHSGKHRRNKVVDPKIYRSQVDAAFRNAGREWKAVYGISNELLKIKQIGDDFVKQQDYVNATTVYEAIVMGVLDHYNEHTDVDGKLIAVINACIDEIDMYIYDTQDDKATHQRCLQVLFAIFRFSVDSGIDMGEEAPDIIVANVTAEERPVVAGWVQDALDQSQKSKWSSDYGLERYRKFLRELEAVEIEDEA